MSHEPAERSFNHPAPRQHSESLRLITPLYDLDIEFRLEPSAPVPLELLFRWLWAFGKDHSGVTPKSSFQY